MRRISFAFVLLELVGCYASEKMGKDIQDTSHDVNQGGIYMHKGALGVYRPEPTTTPQLTSAAMTKAAAPVPAAAPASVETTAPPTKELPLPRKEEEPGASQWPAAPPVTAPAQKAAPPLPNASDAGVSEHGAFSL